MATRCDRQESVSRYSADFDTEHGTDRRIRIRPEDLEVTGRSEVAELHVIAHTSLLENRKDPVFLRGLDVEDEGIGQRIHSKISEDAALLIEQEGIGRCSGRQNLQVRRHKTIQERKEFGAR